ncbi:MAG: bifunctional hydroxymethylpyrimidine kinase/phosphomethylpyrimidine kinase, partial [Actinomycetota bacterium]|nr:bifunctional hydroxymethylpyrimidine kinase/phosphomethylpyrimidine kinase [Actinomycetota bacterium]
MTDDLRLPTAPPGVTPRRVLTIAGSDSGGGAGIQADMRTFALLGVHACVAVTAVTVQNTVGVQGFAEIAPETVTAQMHSVVTDIGVEAVKTGMLASAPIIEAVAAACADLGIGRDRPVPLVVDPVCASMHGDPLLHPSALAALKDKLFPLAAIVTPNLD